MLRADGVKVLETREPGGTPVGEKIRAVLLDSRTSGLSPRAEMALMFGARAQHVDEVILPALAARRLGAVRPLHRFHRSLPGRRPQAGQRARAGAAQASVSRPPARHDHPHALRRRGQRGAGAPPQPGAHPVGRSGDGGATTTRTASSRKTVPSSGASPPRTRRSPSASRSACSRWTHAARQMWSTRRSWPQSRAAADGEEELRASSCWTVLKERSVMLSECGPLLPARVEAPSYSSDIF